MGAIRLFTRGHWNHIVIADGQGGAYEAQPGGVRVVPESWYTDVAWLIHEPFTPEAGAKRAAFCQSMIGTPYNWLAIVAFGPRYLTPSLAGLFARFAERRPKVMCSELATRAVRAGGDDWFPGRLSATVAPEDIDVQFRRQGW